MIAHRSMLSRRLLISFLALLLTAGCGSREDDLTGKWELPPGNGGEFALEFFDGGTVVMTLGDRNYSGTFEMPEDNQVLLLMSGDLGMQQTILTDLEITSDVMAFNLNGEERVELERVQR